MRVRFSDEAKVRLRSIHAHISKDSSARATAMIDRITRRAGEIGDFPHAGRMVPKYERDDLREVHEAPYRIIYRVRRDEIEIATVMHYRQLLPEDLA